MLELCPTYGSEIELISTGDRAVKITCQYEGYARIIADRLKLQKNVAKLHELGYENVMIVFTDIKKNVITLNVETCYLL